MPCGAVVSGANAFTPPIAGLMYQLRLLQIWDQMEQVPKTKRKSTTPSKGPRHFGLSPEGTFKLWFVYEDEDEDVEKPEQNQREAFINAWINSHRDFISKNWKAPIPGLPATPSGKTFEAATSKNIY